MAISASMVKELREKTGAGMMDCKQALQENDGNLEAAIDWLRTKGLAQAAKKAGRVAAEGLIGVKSTGTEAVVVEVNSETDFVARNDTFQSLVRTITDVAVDTDGSLEALTAAQYPGAGKSVGDHVAEMVGTIGENLSLRRVLKIAVGSGAVATYVHSPVTDGLGRIGVLVGLESDGDAEKLAALGRQVAMHVAATSPLAATKEDLDQSYVDREKTVLAEQARESGKPENIIEKMVEGRMRKYFEEVVLLEQTFVIDGERTVGQALKDAEKDVGAPISLKGFARFAIGEGIEKEETDFAAEVAAAVNG
ncbi:MAG: translation elongation factor Ts [Pseudomonadota bacterium]